MQLSGAGKGLPCSCWGSLPHCNPMCSLEENKSPCYLCSHWANCRMKFISIETATRIRPSYCSSKNSPQMLKRIQNRPLLKSLWLRVGAATERREQFAAASWACCPAVQVAAGLSKLHAGSGAISSGTGGIIQVWWSTAEFPVLNQAGKQLYQEPKGRAIQPSQVGLTLPTSQELCSPARWALPKLGPVKAAASHNNVNYSLFYSTAGTQTSG